MAFITARKDTLIVTSMGYTFDVKTKQPQWIPDRALEDALKKGCYECKEDGSLILHEEDEAAVPDTNPHEELLAKVPVLSAEDRNNISLRIDAAKCAVRYLLAVGDPKDFRKDNAPKVSSVSRVLGFDVTFGEMLGAYDAVLKE